MIVFKNTHIHHIKKESILFIYLFIHLFHKDLLDTNYMSGTVPGCGDTAVFMELICQ